MEYNVQNVVGIYRLRAHIKLHLCHGSDVVISLFRLSKYVTDRSQSAEIVGLLLPFLGRRLKRSEEVEVNLLMSVTNLIGNCDQPQQFIP